MTHLDHRRRRTGRERGFTMVELMITLVVTVFALMGLLALNTTFSHGSTSVSQTQEAVTVGERVLEELRAKRIEDLSAELTGSRTSAPPFSRDSYASVSGRNGMTYTVDVAVTSVTASLWRMRVVVAWTVEGSQEPRRLPLELLRASTEAL